jgi:DNA mismatch repair protein MutS
MVEMIETASILLHATPRSLVVLDEVGRGTSTYDGMSIAQAVLEHIHNAPALGCRTLFATHYHELTALASRLPRVRNYNVAVADEGGDIAFLHRIVPGGADRSYGVHVAQLAGLPRPVVRRAWELLGEHEQEQKEAVANSGAKPGAASPSAQLALFGAPIAEPSPALEVLAALDLDDLTPIEALNKLFELRRLAEGTKGDGDGNLGATP